MPLSRESAASIGAQLLKGRRARGWTVRRLMEESGAYIDHAYYSNIESGRQTLALVTLRRITEALNLDLDRMLAEAQCQLSAIDLRLRPRQPIGAFVAARPANRGGSPAGSLLDPDQAVLAQ